MGLLNFTKKSRKQQQQGQKPSTTTKDNTQAFSFSPHRPSQEDENDEESGFNPYSTLKSKNFSVIDSPVSKQKEMSLMDDIMNELESVKSIKNNYTTINSNSSGTNHNNIYQNNNSTVSNSTMITKQNNSNIKRGNKYLSLFYSTLFTHKRFYHS